MRKMLMSALLLLLLPVLAFAQGEEVKIVHFGVGHGDCTLIIVKDYDKTNRPTLQTVSILIDTGEQENGKGLWDAVWPYIRNAGGKSLDYLITSHLHKDHVGGAGSLLEHLNKLYNIERRKKIREYDWLKNLEIIDRLSFTNKMVKPYQQWYARIPKDGFLPRYKSFRSRPKGKIPPRPVLVGEDLLAGFKLRNSQMMCVAANGVIGKKLEAPKDPSNPTKAKNENDLNFAFLLRVGNFRYFTGGDLTGDQDPKKIDMETLLIKEMDRAWGNIHGQKPFHVCALKVGHHGSSHSSNGSFIDYLKPYMAVIEAGHRNFGGKALPRGVVLERFLGTQQLNITWRTTTPYYYLDLGKRLYFTYTIKKSKKALKGIDPTAELEKQPNPNNPTNRATLAKYLKTTDTKWLFAQRQDIILTVTGASVSEDPGSNAPEIKISRLLRKVKAMTKAQGATEIQDPTTYTCNNRVHSNLDLPKYDGK